MDRLWDNWSVSGVSGGGPSAAVTVDIVRDRSHIRLHGRRAALTD